MSNGEIDGARSHVTLIQPLPFDKPSQFSTRCRIFAVTSRRLSSNFLCLNERPPEVAEIRYDNWCHKATIM